MEREGEGERKEGGVGGRGYDSIMDCSFATTSGLESAKLLCSVGSAVMLNKYIVSNYCKINNKTTRQKEENEKKYE